MHQPTKAQIIEMIKRMSRDNRVDLIYIFGSTCKLNSGDTIPIASDVDIAVYVSDEVSTAFTLLDIQTRYLIDIQFEYDLSCLNSIPLYMKKQVIQGECIYFRNKQLKQIVESDISSLWEGHKDIIQNQQKQQFDALLRRYRDGGREDQGSVAEA